MAIQITKTAKGFLLSGRLRTNQLFEIRNFFDTKLNTSNELFLSLVGLEEIDFSTVLFIENLQDHANRKRKKIHVSGGTNQEVFKPLMTEENFKALAA
jgi:ABC-type transporter Mla MlaB component